MKYEIYRHTICGDRDIEDFDYFDSKADAEELAKELTDRFSNEMDNHPWSGDKFFVREISEQVIEDRQRSWAIQRAYAEMYL